MSLPLILHLQNLIPRQHQEITKLKSWFNSLTTEEMEEDEDMMQDWIQQKMDLLSFMEQNLSYLTYKLERNMALHQDDLSADEDEDEIDLADYNTVNFYG